MCSTDTDVSGFANVDKGGVTIDMRDVNAVELDRKDMIVRVGAGALWQDVYDVLEPHDLSVLGGRIGDVGVAGLTLGGEFDSLWWLSSGLQRKGNAWRIGNPDLMFG